eukprot:Blabericola_migrator_1__5596@NODE_2849_length_2288_cov_294_107159_g1786_i0_p1_GENE_NODE_2849_length_2288_cov_294_107159_g1786_i0NODE_2849_length_2288_cov_294_107159_g1786_i0_p1_ORF_typecomplete_len424_score86_03Peptidase_A22B/PF04258_13/4_6e03Peptidase_A22B/PF04258_13/4_4e78SPP/PF06550_11/2_1e03SPP/PF06550_11/3e03SPP/PF06550_11/3_9e07PriA_3primeBD/PF17764_1/20PriA_3primeBD/PF17764_1/41_NODE_2849_length_2288_cov_294_107159_g1786_i06651936
MSQTNVDAPRPNLAAAFANVACELHKLNLENTKARIFCAAVGGIFMFMGISRVVMIPILAQMLIYTLPILWLGSHMSLDFRVQVEEGSRDKDEGEVISRDDATKFPLHASGAILALYVALKVLPSKLVNLLLSGFVGVLGIFSVGQTMVECLKLSFPASIDEGPTYTFSVPKLFAWGLGKEVKIKISKATVAGHIIACIISLGWLLTKAWALHNLMAIAFCTQAINMISVGTFKIASILLVGLFFYDVFWVFGTEVMVKVATGFDAPVKLLFPISQSPVKYSLLGLGDIVIPGIFIAMTLRFDYWIWRKTHDAPKDIEVMQRVFPKFYFHSSLVAYALSITFTGCVLLFFKKAQPALLYLVPAMLVSVYVPAFFKGQLAEVNEFSEEEEKEEKEDSETAEDDGEEVATSSGAEEEPTESKKDK